MIVDPGTVEMNQPATPGATATAAGHRATDLPPGLPKAKALRAPEARANGPMKAIGAVVVVEVVVVIKAAAEEVVVSKDAIATAGAATAAAAVVEAGVAARISHGKTTIPVVVVAAVASSAKPGRRPGNPSCPRYCPIPRRAGWKSPRRALVSSVPVRPISPPNPRMSF